LESKTLGLEGYCSKTPIQVERSLKTVVSEMPLTSTIGTFKFSEMRNPLLLNILDHSSNGSIM